MSKTTKKFVKFGLAMLVITMVAFVFHIVAGFFGASAVPFTVDFIISAVAYIGMSIQNEVLTSESVNPYEN